MIISSSEIVFVTNEVSLYHAYLKEAHGNAISLSGPYRS